MSPLITGQQVTGAGSTPWGILRSGLYAPSPLSLTISGSISTGFERCIPFYLPKETTFDRIACEVVTAGTAGAVVRLGIRQSGSDGMPSTLELDAGTVVADGTTGIKEKTISQTLAAGIWWLEACTQVAASTLRVHASNVGSFAVALPQFSPSSLGASYVGYYNSSGGVTGALPSAFTPNVSLGAGSAPIVVLRVA